MREVAEAEKTNNEQVGEDRQRVLHPFMGGLLYSFVLLQSNAAIKSFLSTPVYSLALITLVFAEIYVIGRNFRAK